MKSFLAPAGSVLLALSLSIGIVPASASSLNILTLDETRSGTISNANGSINFNFAVGGGYQQIRNNILNPANFGPSGIVDRPVIMNTMTPQITTQTLSGADVVILTRHSGLSTDEINALQGFVMQGGGLIGAYNTVAAELGGIFGAASGAYSSSGIASVTNNNSPITNGPFGSYNIGTSIATGYAGSFSNLGAFGTSALSNNAGVFAATFELGLGRSALFADEELFLNQPYVTNIASALLSNTSNNLLLNALNFVAPDAEFSPDDNISAVPLPAGLWLFISGILGLMRFSQNAKNRTSWAQST